MRAHRQEWLVRACLYGTLKASLVAIVHCEVGTILSANSPTFVGSTCCPTEMSLCFLELH